MNEFDPNKKHPEEDEDDLFQFDKSAHSKDDLFFTEESDYISESTGTKSDYNWKVLVVDDEEDVHTVTHMALDGFELQNKFIKFIDAYSAAEAKKILRETPDIAIVLLDVVMESNNAGLELIKFIREEINNHFTRIILRTGQPGEAPERDIIRAYQINDYKTKTELTSDKLFTAVLASLRTYEAMVMIDSYRHNLEVKVQERTSDLEKSLLELKKAQDEIISLERKTTALAMAVTTSHEINQPLMVIRGSIDLLNLTLPEEILQPNHRKHLQRIDDSVSKIHSIIEKFRNLDEIKFNDYTDSTKMVSLDRTESQED